MQQANPDAGDAHTSDSDGKGVWIADGQKVGGKWVALGGLWEALGSTVNEKLAQLPQPRRGKIERHAADLTNQELSLRELRRALGRTQTKIANSLNVGQDTVARYEQRSDMLLSTLRRYIAAAGGQLSLIAEFPGRPSGRLKGIGDIISESTSAPRAPCRRESARRVRTA